MKVLFLDFDGVLNNKAFFEGFKGRFVPDEDMIDPQAVGLLQDIIDKTGAKIVISSSWRKGFDLEELQAMLKNKGLVRAEIIGKTPAKMSLYHRGGEIRMWLRDYVDKSDPIEGIVILDDDSDMESLMPWLVQTFWETGLLPEHVGEAERTIGTQPPDIIGANARRRTEERSPEND